MKNNVINFEKEKIKYHIKQYETTGYADDFIVRYRHVNQGYTNDITRTIDQIVAKLNARSIKQFEEEFEQLTESFSSERAQFKFPTIQSRYTKTTNPVRALFNEVQRILFRINEFDCVDKWILGLLKDHDFYSQLIQSLKHDVDLISKFVEKWKNELCQSYKIKDELRALDVLKENLNYYREVFEVIHYSDYNQILPFL